MSMSYFEDANSQLMPKMYLDVNWEEIKSFIRKAVRDFQPCG